MKNRKMLLNLMSLLVFASTGSRVLEAGPQLKHLWLRKCQPLNPPQQKPLNGSPATEMPATECPATEAPAAEIDPELIAAAQAEGTLTTIALPHDWCNYGEVIESFKSKYGLEVNELNPDAGSGDEIEAIKANKDNTGPQAPDVIDVGFAFGASAKDEGLIQPYKVSTWDTIPDDAKDAEGYWYGDYYGVLSFLVNTDVQPDVPQDWADLLDPKYNGQVALSGDPRTSNQAIQSVFAASLANGGSLDDAQPGLDFFADLNAAGNLVPLIANNGLVATGETACPYHLGLQCTLRRSIPLKATRSRTCCSCVWSFRRCVCSGPSAPMHRIRMPPNCGWNSFTRMKVSFCGWRVIATRSAKRTCAKRGVIPEDLLAKLPDVSGAVFPTLEQLNAAR